MDRYRQSAYTESSLAHARDPRRHDRPPRDTMPVTRFIVKDIVARTPDVNSKVINTLLSLLDEGITMDFPRQLLRLTTNLVQRLIDRTVPVNP